MQRRSFIRTLTAAGALLLVLPQTLLASVSTASGNFKQIYSNLKLKNEFFKFLKNVFNLMPEGDLHKLISDTVEQKQDDKSIYLNVQTKLDDITPIFSGVRYGLPALQKQKDDMAQ